jgi:PIN domain nuclease of toxin-antitoxin system
VDDIAARMEAFSRDPWARFSIAESAKCGTMLIMNDAAIRLLVTDVPKARELLANLWGSHNARS